MKEKKEYSEKQLVSFANYVLSYYRNSLISKDNDKSVVYDSDLSNWKDNQKRKKISKIIVENTKSF